MDIYERIKDLTRLHDTLLSSANEVKHMIDSLTRPEWADVSEIEVEHYIDPGLKRPTAIVLLQESETADDSVMIFDREQAARVAAEILELAKDLYEEPEEDS